jgi:hypothetical protein
MALVGTGFGGFGVLCTTGLIPDAGDFVFAGDIKRVPRITKTGGALACCSESFSQVIERFVDQGGSDTVIGQRVVVMSDFARACYPSDAVVASQDPFRDSSQIVIDPLFRGSLARFANMRCMAPTCEFQMMVITPTAQLGVQGQPLVNFVEAALKDVADDQLEDPPDSLFGSLGIAVVPRDTPRAAQLMSGVSARRIVLPGQRVTVHYRPENGRAYLDVPCLCEDCAPARRLAGSFAARLGPTGMVVAHRGARGILDSPEARSIAHKGAVVVDFSADAGSFVADLRSSAASGWHTTRVVRVAYAAAPYKPEEQRAFNAPWEGGDPASLSANQIDAQLATEAAHREIVAAPSDDVIVTTMAHLRLPRARSKLGFGKAVDGATHVLALWPEGLETLQGRRRFCAAVIRAARESPSVTTVLTNRPELFTLSNPLGMIKLRGLADNAPDSPVVFKPVDTVVVGMDLLRGAGGDDPRLPTVIKGRHSITVTVLKAQGRMHAGRVLEDRKPIGNRLDYLWHRALYLGVEWKTRTAVAVPLKDLLSSRDEPSPDDLACVRRTRGVYPWSVTDRARVARVVRVKKGEKK